MIFAVCAVSVLESAGADVAAKTEEQADGYSLFLDAIRKHQPASKYQIPSESFTAEAVNSYSPADPGGLPPSVFEGLFRENEESIQLLILAGHDGRWDLPKRKAGRVLVESGDDLFPLGAYKSMCNVALYRGVDLIERGNSASAVDIALALIRTSNQLLARSTSREWLTLNAGGRHVAAHLLARASRSANETNLKRILSEVISAVESTPSFADCIEHQGKEHERYIRGIYEIMFDSREVQGGRLKLLEGLDERGLSPEHVRKIRRGEELSLRQWEEIGVADFRARYDRMKEGCVEESYAGLMLSERMQRADFDALETLATDEKPQLFEALIEEFNRADDGGAESLMQRLRQTHRIVGERISSNVQRMITPPVDMMLHRWLQTVIRERAVILQLGVRVHEREFGSRLAGVDALVSAGVVDELTTMDPFTGRRLVLRRWPAQVPFVYSLGIDRDDDRGARYDASKREGDIAADSLVERGWRAPQ